MKDSNDFLPSVSKVQCINRKIVEESECEILSESEDKSSKKSVEAELNELIKWQKKLKLMT